MGNQTGAARSGLAFARVAVVAALGAAGVAAMPLGGVAASGASLAFSYSKIAPVPIGTNEAQSVVVGDKLYLLGGFDALKTTFTPTSRGWVYDPASNVWHALPSMPVNGITHAGIATDGSRFIYYAGGSASAQNATQQVFGSTDAFSYDTVTGTYSRLPSLPAPRMGGGLGWVGGKLYYFGGNNITRTLDTGDTWMLDLDGGATSWVARASMPDPRNHIGFATSGGLIYAVGGQHLDKSSTAQGELDRYDPASEHVDRAARHAVAARPRHGLDLLPRRPAGRGRWLDDHQRVRRCAGLQPGDVHLGRLAQPARGTYVDDGEGSERRADHFLLRQCRDVLGHRLDRRAQCAADVPPAGDHHPAAATGPVTDPQPDPGARGHQLAGPDHLGVALRLAAIDADCDSDTSAQADADRGCRAPVNRCGR